MARRRRMRSNFGAPPEAHRKLAGKERELADEAAGAAIRDAGQGRCDDAVRAFKRAAHHHGGMFAHILSLAGSEREGYDTSYNHIAKRVDAAGEAVGACFLRKKR